VTLELPQRLISRTRARNASLVFAARNIRKWTNYRGSDPESDYTVTGGGDSPNEFQTFAAPRMFQFPFQTSASDPFDHHGYENSQ